MGLFTHKPRTEGTSDPVKLLIADHEKVERLFAEIEGADSVGPRFGLVAQLDAELLRHTQMEEEIVYPFIREHVDDGDRLMDEAEQEHAEAKSVLAEVRTLDPSRADFEDRLKTLKKLIQHHVKEEEGRIFPKLEQSTDVVALNKLRGALEQAKKDTAPSPQLPAEGRGAGAATQRRSGSTGPSARRGGSTSPRGRKPSVWVQPHHTQDGMWQVRRDGATRASRVFETQREAEEFARGTARRERVELIVAGRDGEVREKTSYGNDPNPPKG